MLVNELSHERPLRAGDQRRRLRSEPDVPGRRGTDRPVSRLRGRPDRFAFRTPTLRNVMQAAPLMHHASRATLREAAEGYDRGSGPDPQRAALTEPSLPGGEEKRDLVAFP